MHLVYLLILIETGLFIAAQYACQASGCLSAHFFKNQPTTMGAPGTDFVDSRL